MLLLPGRQLISAVHHWPSVQFCLNIQLSKTGDSDRQVMDASTLVLTRAETFAMDVGRVTSVDTLYIHM